jgi:SAM-dependent methyltransferase
VASGKSTSAKTQGAEVLIQSPTSAPRWSFRDPAGRVIVHEGRVWRIVNSSANRDLELMLSSQVVVGLLRRGELVPSEKINLENSTLPENMREQVLSDPGAVVLEHESIWFPSFPYEWPPEMLYAAGKLTLDVAEELLANGFGLKDATPFNVLFRGPLPVFVDLLSIERRDPHDPLWLPYAQFLRTFLLPLLMNRYFAMPLQRIFLSDREGLEPEEVFRSCNVLQRFRSPFLRLVSLPTWLSQKKEQDTIYRPKRLKSAEHAQFVLRGTLRKLRRSLEKLRPEIGDSRWSSYTDNTNYSSEELAAKLDFVTSGGDESQAQRVLDLGSNTGRFSIACAQHDMEVVAVDSDPVVVGRLWRQASADHLRISPLVLNIAQPTPATGWRNEECLSFLDRARGQFDMVLMLALVHHLLIRDRVPLPEILRFAAELTKKTAVVEFVPAEDLMFKRMLRGRESLHADFTRQRFEQECTKFFRIARTQQLAPNGRCLYLLTK